MNEKAVKWNKIKRQIWIKQSLGKAKLKVGDAWEWIVDNKEFALASVTAVSALIGKGIKLYDRAQERKNRKYVYDYSMRTHRKLKRGPLTTKQKIEINRLREMGYSYHDIYNMMGIVK